MDLAFQQGHALGPLGQREVCPQVFLAHEVRRHGLDLAPCPVNQALRNKKETPLPIEQRGQEMKLAATYSPTG